MRRLMFHFCCFMARWAYAESNMWARMEFDRLSWHAFCAYNYWDFKARKYR